MSVRTRLTFPLILAALLLLSIGCDDDHANPAQPGGGSTPLVVTATNPTILWLASVTPDAGTTLSAGPSGQVGATFNYNLGAATTADLSMVVTGWRGSTLVYVDAGQAGTLTAHDGSFVRDFSYTNLPANATIRFSLSLQGSGVEAQVTIPYRTGL